MQKEPERKKFEIYLYAPYNRPLEQTVIIFHSIITFSSLGNNGPRRETLCLHFAIRLPALRRAFQFHFDDDEAERALKVSLFARNFFIIDAKGTHKLRNDRLTRSQRLGAALLKLRAPHMPIIVALAT
jgi:hypothetical protein